MYVDPKQGIAMSGRAPSLDEENSYQLAEVPRRLDSLAANDPEGASVPCRGHTSFKDRARWAVDARRRSVGAP